MLAYQVGSEVSYTELGTSLGLSKDTVASYVDLLEKAFIVFRLEGFSRNLRNEVTRNSKVYFYDQGVRNVAMGDFRSFAARQDQGALWENFLIAERRKRQLPGVENRFWRLGSDRTVPQLAQARPRTRHHKPQGDAGHDAQGCPGQCPFQALPGPTRKVAPGKYHWSQQAESGNPIPLEDWRQNRQWRE